MELLGVPTVVLIESAVGSRSSLGSSDTVLRGYDNPEITLIPSVDEVDTGRVGDVVCDVGLENSDVILALDDVIGLASDDAIRDEVEERSRTSGETGRLLEDEVVDWIRSRFDVDGSSALGFPEEGGKGEEEERRAIASS